MGQVAVCSVPTDALRRVASRPEDLLGSGGGILHGGADCHLHVPVQKRVGTVQTDHGHVRGGVSPFFHHLCQLNLCLHGEPDH